MDRSPSKQQLREFGLLIGLGIPLLLGWLLPLLHGDGFRLWTLWIGLPALLLGFLAPRSLQWPYRGWMALGHGLGWINSHVILGAVFLLILQPIALIMRCRGYDPLNRRRRSQASSYRQPCADRAAPNLRRIF
jgi:hypothetical protein